MKFFSRKTEALAQADDEHIEGERSTPSIARPASLQARVSNGLAIGLMSVLGIGLLLWYYAHTMSRADRAREQAKSSSRMQATGDTALPPLGPIDPPDPQPSATEQLLGPAPIEPSPDHVPDAWLKPAEDAPPRYSTPPPQGKTPEQLALERKLAGPVVVNRSAVAMTGSEDSERRIGEGGQEPTGAGGMAALLKPSLTPAAHARILPTQRLLLAKGAFLDCTLETAIDSTLPGMTTCITATDTFGVDGSIVLMERGTKLIGETRGQVQQGSARIFVLWTEARTPTGVVIPLDSPGTDELGRSGLPGRVNRHFWDRFGAAILISVIDGAIQREMQSSTDGGTIIYNPSASQDIMTEVLKSTINIPPTVTKRNGDRIQILVARDLDFRTVYELRPAAR